jgi:hypothetical protein
MTDQSFIDLVLSMTGKEAVAYAQKHGMSVSSLHEMAADCIVHMSDDDITALAKKHCVGYKEQRDKIMAIVDKYEKMRKG